MTSASQRFRRFVCSLRTERDLPGGLLAACILFYAVSTACLALGGRPARFFVERMQLQTESFAAWAAFSPSPWMYNFENRALVSPIPLSPAERAEALEQGRFRYYNHYPARIATFADERPRHMLESTVMYLYLDSRYRDVTVQSGFKLEALDHETSRKTHHLRLERLAVTR